MYVDQHAGQSNYKNLKLVVFLNDTLSLNNITIQFDISKFYFSNQ